MPVDVVVAVVDAVAVVCNYAAHTVVVSVIVVVGVVVVVVVVIARAADAVASCYASAGC